MLKLLNTDKSLLLTEYCVERFGMHNEIFKKYTLYEGSKNLSLIHISEPTRPY